MTKLQEVLTHRPRPPYHHGDLARALLQAADEIIEEEGLEAFTLRSCARRAGVSHAAPAHHFKDRAGLLSAYAASIFRDLTAFVEDHVQQAGLDNYDRLQAVGLAYIRFALQRPSAFSLIFRCESLDKNAIELIKKNLDKIHWGLLSRNKNAIGILKENKDKIYWDTFAANPKLFDI